MTNRLYYSDPYLTWFESRVVSCIPQSDTESIVYLEESAFYPTSGGQPFDTGTLGDLEILDVFVDDSGDVAHRVKGTLCPGQTVTGQIDWERRFDHMQQHAGEHILAGCLHRSFGGHTIGLHLGHADSSIDVELPGGATRLSNEELHFLEDEVNARIQADLPIRCWFPDSEELAALPLRKPPTVKEHVRVVQIGNDEFCACGGTHPSSAGQIGLFKLTDARPSKGKLRLTFVCGKRANRLFASCMDTIKSLSAIFSVPPENLSQAAEETVKKLKDAQYRMEKEKARRAMELVEGDLKTASEGTAIVKRLFDGLGTDALLEAANCVTSRPGAYALLGSRQEQGTLLLFARSQDAAGDMGKLLQACARRFGGKGGGRPDFARGSVPDESALDWAEETLRQSLDQ